MTPRIAAYETLIRLEKEKQFSNIAIGNAIKKYHFEKRERDFYTRLVYGVVEKKLTLDYLVKQYTEKSPSRLDLSVLTVLRLSLYQLFFLDQIPQSAAVSEGVSLAARFASRAKGYVNAILRKACREMPLYPSEHDPESYRLSILYSVSEDIVKLLLEQYPGRAEVILNGYSLHPLLSLQVNARDFTPELFIDNYQLKARTISSLSHAVKLSEAVSVSDMPFLANGQAFVQDIASQLTTEILSPKPDDFIIDVCACPGGKSFSAANYMTAAAQGQPVTGHILACDIHDSKLSLVKDGATRLGYSFIETRCQDAQKPMSDCLEKADKIICDVPCSGLGVINKKPELRYKDIAEIHAITEIQRNILTNASRYLKSGGTLLYSTCTLNREENEKIVWNFLESHEDFVLCDFEVSGENLSYQSENGCLTLFPTEVHDGFFMAKIQRK